MNERARFTRSCPNVLLLPLKLLEDFPLNELEDFPPYVLLDFPPDVLGPFLDLLSLGPEFKRTMPSLAMGRFAPVLEALLLAPGFLAPLGFAVLAAGVVAGFWAF